jgi:predicted Zn-dependent peptidase
MRRSTPLLFLLLLPLVAPRASAEPAAPSLPCEAFTLPNGLRVILHADHRLALVVLDVWYHVGAKDERAGRAGFAHLFEHLMFMGTKRVPRGKFDEIMEAGGAWNNAATDFDYTDYYDVGPSRMLPTLLWLEADRMEGLGKAMTQEKLDVQRDVVLNEFRESYDNAPYGAAELRIYQEMFPPGHPYHHAVIGSHEDIRAATVDDVKSFFGTYYVPNNATLTVAGDFDVAATRALIGRLFGAVPRADDPPRPHAAPATLTGGRRVTLPDDVQLPRLSFVWHSPAYYRPGDAAMDVIASVLANGRNGRLQQRLVHGEQAAVDISAWQEDYGLGSLFRVDATAAPGVDPDTIEKMVDEEIEKLRREGPRDDEIQRIRNTLETDTVSDLQSLINRADRLADYDTYLGSPDRLAWDLERYHALTPQAVREAADRWLAPDRRLLLRVLPRGGEPDEDAIDHRPPESAATDFVPPEPAVFRLENGLEVWHLARPGLPLVSGELMIPVGSTSDGPNAAGRAYLAARMLLEGAGDLDALQFDAAREQLGATLLVDATRDSTLLYFQSLKRNAGATLDLLSLAVTQPRYDAKDWDRLRTKHIGQLEQVVDDPEVLAERAAVATLYPDAPYGTPISGTPRTVAGLTREDLAAFHRAGHVPLGAKLFLVGDLTREEAEGLARQALGAWTPPTPTPASILPAKAPETSLRTPRVVLVDRPGAEQTVVRLLLPAPAWPTSRDRIIEAANEVLGGSFTSRLNAVLREQMGATYGAYSSYAAYRDTGWIQVSTAIETSATKAGLKALFDQVRAFGRGDATKAEVARARQTLRSNLVQEFEALDDTLGSYLSYARYGGGPQGLAADATALGAVTVEKVNEAARKWFGLGLGAPVLVLVGDPQAMREALVGLDLPAPREMTAAEVLE